MVYVRACVRAYVRDVRAYHVHCAVHCAVCTVHGVRVSVSETKHIGDSRTGKQPQSKQFARLIDFPWHPRFGVTGPCNALHRPICGDKRSHEHTNASTSTNSIGYGILPFDYQTGLRPADCKSVGKLCAAGLYGTSSIVSTIDRISLYRCLCTVFCTWKYKLAMYGIIIRYEGTTHRGFAKERRNRISSDTRENRTLRILRFCNSVLCLFYETNYVIQIVSICEMSLHKNINMRRTLFIHFYRETFVFYFRYSSTLLATSIELLTIEKRYT